jgi:nitrous oxide reductase accessory protein NosL
MFAIIAGLCLSLSGILFAQEDIKKIPACKYCGMDREKFAHSRIFIEYDDGTAEGTCSIHCAAVELALNIDKNPKAIWVGDMSTKKLIDAEKASWTMGGGKPGVMTKRAKWAFEKKEVADQFIKDNGGTPVNFDLAIKASYEDMYEDTKLIRERRKMRKMQHK